MKKYVFAILFAFWSSVGFAYTPYARLSIGLTSLINSNIYYNNTSGEISFKDSCSFSAAFGSRFTESLRAELELTETSSDFKTALYKDFKAKNGKITVFTFLANGYFDFINDSPFTPFVSVGLGGVHIAHNDIIFSKKYEYQSTKIVQINADKTLVLAYQFGAGISFALNSQLVFDFNYRYLGTGKSMLGSHKKRLDTPSYMTDIIYLPNSKVEANLTTHTLFLDVRYTF